VETSTPAAGNRFLFIYPARVARWWGIHNDSDLDLVEQGFVSIDWSEVGDHSNKPVDRESLKAILAKTYPDAKAGAIPVWAGVLNRFFSEMQIGDMVVSPNRARRTINLGRIASDYYFEKDAESHPNRRRVEWLKTEIPRSEFPASALHEIGAAIALFEVKRHRDVFEAQLVGGKGVPTVVESTDEELEDEPNAERVEAFSRDHVEKVLGSMEPARFERFVAAVLRAMGYRADVTRISNDGGVDVLASRDPLRLQPPTIKVQVKRKTSQIGGPEVQALLGTLSPGGGEVALFVTLGNYSNDAIHIARTRQDIRLLTGRELIDLVFEHYEGLEPEWQREIPLRMVYAVDRGLLR